VVPIVVPKGLKLQVIILIREALKALKIANIPPGSPLKCALNYARNLWNTIALNIDPSSYTKNFDEGSMNLYFLSSTLRIIK
jgi:hypothetical protein